MPTRRVLPAVLVVLVAVGAVAAGVRAQPEDPAAARQKYMALAAEVQALFASKDYAGAEAKCREMIALVPRDPSPTYNLACALARQGKTADALAALEKAVELGFDDTAHIKADEDLASLRTEAGFVQLLAAAEEARKAELDLLYEEGEEIEGVRTVEGDPEGGLRWRLRISPEAGAEKKHRLVVWLHPSGGSMNAIVEALSPDLVAAGFALLVPTAKRWMSWSGEEAKALEEKTLPDVAKVEGVDASRPVLMGFSAGGQMALEMWAADPGRYGALVLDAAYPIDAAAYGRGEVRARSLPEGEARRQVPMYVLVGAEDGGHRLWKQVEEPWRTAGVPLTVVYVPRGRHEWLLRGEQKPAFLAWLREVGAGKTPGAPAPTPAGETTKPEPEPVPAPR